MDIPSLFMIPSAVSSGKVHSVFPNSTDADFDFNRDSDATRVNSEGLIERVGYYGSEEVTNNTFSSATGWTLESGWSIANNYAVANTTSGFIYQIGGGLTNGKKYKVTFSISEYQSGSVFFGFGTGLVLDAGASVSANGDYTQFVNCTTSGTKYVGFKGVSFTGKINNFSVKEITGDRARLNYEIEGGLVNTKPSLLLEPQSTNLVTYSEDFSQWTIDGEASISLDSIISPDGTRNSDKIIAGTTSGRQAIKFSSSNSGNLSFSIFAKKGGYTVLQFSDARDGTAYANFNLDTGAVGNSSVYTASIVEMGNDWYRCKISWNASLSINNIRVGIVTTATSARVEEFAGNGSDGLYIYGAMLEQQAFSTSYIPTNGSTQTRAAETCNGAGTSSILPSEEGILYIETSVIGLTSDLESISISDGTYNNAINFRYYNTSNNQIQYVVRVGGSVVATINFTLSDALAFNKIALRYKANDFALWANGTQVGTDTSGAIPTGLSTLQLDRGDGSGDFYGKIRDIRVYNTKEMTDSEVDILLTKITS